MTGCNKGIGYGIIEKLVEKPFKIIMGVRSKERGIEARDKLCGGDESKLKKIWDSRIRFIKQEYNLDFRLKFEIIKSWRNWHFAKQCGNGL